MGKINILDKHVAELIAAGEVVERPSSVIKELVENAIDAGADSITVEIKNGGVTFMRVSDNGAGILREDIRPAFIRHATSKIREEDDLGAIATLGFRGEALSSIAAVSHLELITKAKEEETGTRYLIDGSEEISLSDAGCPDGTTFIIRDLFFNVPARMKFLKTDKAEGNAVSNVVDKIALSHPEIALTYIKDEKTVLKTAGDGKLLSAIYAVYGREFAGSLISVDYELSGVKVSGYISKPEFARPNRNMQNFFINNRYVISKTAMAALSEACKGSVMVGKFPSCVLNITMSFSAVDVNVHPTKLEVRFLNERPVFDAVYHGVKTALMNDDKAVQATLKPAKAAVDPFSLAKKAFRQKEQERAFNAQFLSLERSHGDRAGKPFSATAQNAKTNAETIRQPSVNKDSKDDTGETAAPAVKQDNPFSLLDDLDSLSPINMHPTVSDTAADGHKFDIEKKENENAVSPNKAENAGALTETLFENAKEKENAGGGDIKPLVETDGDRNRFIGEAFLTYIIIEKNERELMLIDKHAAHERIIFEKLKKEKGAGSAQMLLTPLTVTLNKIDYHAAVEHLDVFSEAGFDIDDFGEGTLIIRSAPQYLDLDDIEPSVIEMAGYLSDNKKEIRSQKMEWIYHNVSCRAAIKGGNRSSDKELIELAKMVEDEDIRHCPHGRPVSVIIKKTEIEKLFGRIQ